MKISDAHGSYLHQVYLNETVGSGSPDASDRRATGQEDDISRNDTIVSLSASSQDLRIAEDSLASAPEFRPEKVQHIQEAMGEGRYEINAQRIAEKLIGSIVDRFV